MKAKKLRLNRETLHRLSESTLQEVGGGTAITEDPFICTGTIVPTEVPGCVTLGCNPGPQRTVPASVCLAACTQIP